MDRRLNQVGQGPGRSPSRRWVCAAAGVALLVSIGSEPSGAAKAGPKQAPAESSAATEAHRSEGTPAPTRTGAADANIAPPGEQSLHFDAKARAGKKDLIGTLHAEGNFESFLKALESAGLAPTLQGRGPLTVFAPTDEAFAKASSGRHGKLLKDPKQLKGLLRYHLLRAYVPTKQLVRLKNALTLNGNTVRVDGTAGIRVGDGTVVKSDIWANNGVIHAIDTVLVPPERAPKKGDAKKAADDAEPEKPDGN